MEINGIKKCWNCGKKITHCSAYPKCPMPDCLGWRHLNFLAHLCDLTGKFYASPLKQVIIDGIRYVGNITKKED